MIDQIIKHDNDPKEDKSKAIDNNVSPAFQRLKAPAICQEKTCDGIEAEVQSFHFLQL
jgi:hypothetical protein